jgi:hypothetical protein
MVPTMAGAGGDVLDEAVQLITAAAREGIPLRLLGGLAVRCLCPAFPPRAREGQDVDMASVSSARSALARFLAEHGCVPDKEFNQLYGHKQMYFLSADGSWAVDVMIDRLDMCHVLDFKDRIERMPHTLDPTDLLLSKLQIVEINEKDLQDAVYLLSAFPVQTGDQPGTIGLEWFTGVLSEDWGWWRTVSANLDRITSLAPADRTGLVPADAAFDPVEQAGTLRRHADQAPKGLKWRLRSKIGDRVRWYELPEEIAHH